MNTASKRLEWGLIGASALLLGAAWLFTYWNINADRKLTLSTSLRLIGSLAASLEEHFDEVLRGAGNAVQSAAARIESAGGTRAYGGGLHAELKRELADDTAVAQLVATDGAGRVVATSSEGRPSGISGATSESFAWHASHPERRDLHLGVPYRSAESGKMVIPYSRAVFNARGVVTGAVVAELRAEHFAAQYDALAEPSRASIVVFDRDGFVLMRVPYDESFIGRRATDPAAFEKMLEGNGNTEFTSALDGKTRYYSHRVMEGHPILVAVGLESEDVMAPWRARSQQRLAVIGLSTVFFLALVGLLVVYLRRLALSENQLRDAVEVSRKLNVELEERVLLRTAELEDAARELRAFSYSVSHDLRAPLRIVSGYVEMLKASMADRLTQDERGKVDRIGSAVERMDQLIEDMLMLFRVGSKELHLTEVDLSAIATQVVADLRGADRRQNETTVLVQENMRAWADAGLVRIVLENLIDNAWKFTAKTAAPRIEVGSEVDADGTSYHVRDNGAGFDMRHADRLFVPFQRLHLNEEFAGTGVGLATAARIVRRHGGRIWADAGLGTGAAFHFTLGPGRGSDRSPPPSAD